MSVYKTTKSPYWQYDFQFRGIRFHGSTGCKVERDAKRFEEGVRRKATVGQGDRDDISVDAGVDLWWEAKGSSQSAWRTMEYQAAALIETLGPLTPVSAVTLRDFDRHVSRRRKTLSAASVNRELALGRQVWRWLKARHYAVQDIAWGEVWQKEPKERVRELSPEEEVRLFHHLPEDLAPIVSFALLSGQRRTEIVNLKWSEVDFVEMQATVTAKGGKRHTFPLTEELVALINAQPRVLPQVFTYQCTKQAPRRKDRVERLAGNRYPFSKQGWAGKWRKALADAKIEDFRFHDLRHTAATRLVRQCGNLKIAQTLLGHSDLKTTGRYAHVTSGDVREAMESMGSRNSPRPKLRVVQ